jgi:hypothetical protein
MKESDNSTMPEIPPEIFSTNSILVGCSGADRFVGGLEFETTEAQRKGLLVS